MIKIQITNDKMPYKMAIRILSLVIHWSLPDLVIGHFILSAIH